jgi:large subunit ribosomal protein L22
MDVVATTKYVRISPQKVGSVIHLIRGLPAQQALDLMNFSPRKAGRFIGRTVRSAMANAENNFEIDPSTLWVKEAMVGNGPALKRFQAKARGMAGPVLKRTSHIRIVLTDTEPR